MKPILMKWSQKRWLTCLLLVLAALGLVGLWAAVFADVGVSVLAICNALRCLRPVK